MHTADHARSRRARSRSVTIAVQPPSARAVLALLAVIGLLGAALVAGAPRAHAEGDRADDARRDVGTLLYPATRGADLFRTGPGSTRAAGSRQAGDATLDITTFRSSYKNDRISLKVGVRRLAESGYQVVGYVTVGQEGKYGLAYDTQYTDGQVFLFERGGAGIACDGLSGKANPEKNLVRVSMPASCIGDPKAIRTGALAGRDIEGGLRVDDARSAKTPEFGSEPVVGKKLRED